MRIAALGAAALLALGFAGSPASALSLGVSVTGAQPASSGLVVKVHGFHRACMRGPRGHWHRHTRHGREECYPRNWRRYR